MTSVALYGSYVQGDAESNIDLVIVLIHINE